MRAGKNFLRKPSGTAADDHASSVTLFGCAVHFPMCVAHVSSCSPLVPITGIVSRGSINTRDFAAHRANVGAQLAAMVNDVKQRNPEQPSDGVLQYDLFRTLKQPRLMVPSAVVQRVQLACETVMITLVNFDHLVATAETAGFLPAQSAVHALSAFAEFNATFLGRN